MFYDEDRTLTTKEYDETAMIKIKIAVKFLF